MLDFVPERPEGIRSRKGCFINAFLLSIEEELQNNFFNVGKKCILKPFKKIHSICHVQEEVGDITCWCWVIGKFSSP